MMEALRTSRYKATIATVLLSAALVAADFFTRSWCFRVCVRGDETGLVGLEPFANFQFVFSLPVPLQAMYVIYASVCLALVYYLWRHLKHFNLITRLAWLLVCLGAISNLFDRLALGFVRDFIRVGTGYVNLADIYILGGLFVLIVFPSSKAQREML